MIKRAGEITRAMLVTAAFAIIPGGISACASEADVPAIEPELPLLGTFQGYYDGHDFSISPVEEVGGATAALVTLDAGAFGTGVVGTGSSYVALEQVSRQTINASVPGSNGWDAPNCGGTVPYAVCVHIRARNLFTSDVLRAHAVLKTLAPGTACSAVVVPPPSATTATAISDFGLAPAVENGLWRFGFLGRSGGVATLPWVFQGTCTAKMTFGFTFEVRGVLARPTQRASLGDGVLDSPSTNYPDVGAAEGTHVVHGDVDVASNGRYVVFTSSSSVFLSSFGLAGGTHVFRKDMTNGAVAWISQPATGVPLSGTCAAASPTISSDGDVVAFASSGCQLTSHGVPGTSQVFQRRVSAAATALVSRSTTAGFVNATAVRPALSGGGGFVVFETAASNVVPGHPGGRANCSEVYRYDLGADVMLRASVPDSTSVAFPTTWAACTGGAPGIRAAVSGNGSLVVFQTPLALNPEDVDTQNDIYVYDAAASVTTAQVYRVSRTSSGGDSNGSSLMGAISDDGSIVAFSSNSGDLVGAATTGIYGIFARGSAEGADASIVRVSSTPSGAAADTAGNVTPAVSPTGRFVGFWSANPLSAPFSVFGWQFYVCDRVAPSSNLRRCFDTSVANLVNGGETIMDSGGGRVGGRVGLSGINNDEEVYAVYSSVVGGSWGSMANTLPQVLVAPVDAARRQMTAVPQP